MTGRDAVQAMVDRLIRDAICMTAWSNGVGPYPATVRGVSAKHAERAKAAAALLTAQQAEIEAKDAEIARLREANQRLRNGYADAVSGYEYILLRHGRLDGVGFQRVQDHFFEWVTMPEREGLLAGSHDLARAALAGGSNND